VTREVMCNMGRSLELWGQAIVTQAFLSGEMSLSAYKGVARRLTYIGFHGTRLACETNDMTDRPCDRHHTLDWL